MDEAHTLIGAGGAAGTGDAANLLKPALARGTLRTIAATTWAEYKKYIEKDPALTRRFQVVQVLEPTEEKATQMVRGVASTLEKHHRVQLLDEALEAAVRLSHRYIPARQLPDKAVSLLDTVCARVAISQHAVPPQLEDCRRTIEALQIELGIIGREEAVGLDTAARRRACEEKLAAAEAWRADLEARWDAEHELADRLLEIRGMLRQAADQAASAKDGSAGADVTKALPEEQRTQLLAELAGLQSQLASLQGESPLILPSVDEQAVAAVVQDWTGVPVGRMVKNEVEALLNLADTLNQRVIGQRHALEMIARRIHTSRAKLDNPNKPIGVFMLCGPSGVGKTETALTLAEALVRRRAERRHDQHERVPGEAHRLHAQGIAARLCRLRRGRHPDRGRPPASLQRRPAGRDREGALRRARAVLPGLRQGVDGGRRRPLHRLQEHGHPADVERRHRAHREHVQGPRAHARRRRALRRRCASRC